MSGNIATWFRTHYIAAIVGPASGAIFALGGTYFIHPYSGSQQQLPAPQIVCAQPPTNMQKLPQGVAGWSGQTGTSQFAMNGGLKDGLLGGLGSDAYIDDRALSGLADEQSSYPQFQATFNHSKKYGPPPGVNKRSGKVTSSLNGMSGFNAVRRYTPNPKFVPYPKKSSGAGYVDPADAGQN
ncbi:hypothetical protein NKH57_02060 [Mesorhizobium sp. M1050]